MTSLRLSTARACLLAALTMLTGVAPTPATARTPPPGPDSDSATGAQVLSRFAAPVEGIHTGGRITPEDLPALRKAGIAHVIDLTPDAESPDFDEAEAVRDAGMSYDNLPIAGPDDLGRESVAAFDQLLGKLQGPALVHCASGNRVGALAALRAAWLQGADDEAAIAEGRRWGLRSLEGEVRARLARERCLADANGPNARTACEAGS